jgi:hypothetical protein
MVKNECRIRCAMTHGGASLIIIQTKCRDFKKFKVKNRGGTDDVFDV